MKNPNRQVVFHHFSGAMLKPTSINHQALANLDKTQVKEGPPGCLGYMSGDETHNPDIWGLFHKP